MCAFGYCLMRALPGMEQICAYPIEVPLAVAMLGGEAQVPTPDGRSLLLRIPSPTQNGRTFRLRGQGMPQRIGQPISAAICMPRPG